VQTIDFYILDFGENYELLHSSLTFQYALKIFGFFLSGIYSDLNIPVGDQVP
jgi:hypothetical protein